MQTLFIGIIILMSTKMIVYIVSIYNKAGFMKLLDNRQYFVIVGDLICLTRGFKQSETID